MYRIALFMVLVLAGGSALAQEDENRVIGRWLTDDGKAVIDIYKKASKFYGKIVWLKEPNLENGKAKVDDKNPEKSLRNRPLMGLNLLKDFQFTGTKWEDGKIYDPETGKTYSCYMELIEQSKLKIRGFIGFSLIGETTYWTREK